jgi:peptidoglycan/LPS O-acetylase OafA/YrhL
MHWVHIATALFYVANMDDSRPWIFGHLWSLSIEEQFYLIWPFAMKKWHRHRTAILLGVLLLTPVFRATLYALKMTGGTAGSLPVYADQLAIGCLLAVFAPRLPQIGKALASLMLLVAILSPWFPATSPSRTLFMLFVLRPLLDLSLAGLLLHVVQHPYRLLNWQPVSWIGRMSYSLYLWQELFCSNAAFHLGYTLIVPSLGCACLSYYFVEKPALWVRENYFGNSLSKKRRVSSLELAHKNAAVCT